MLLEYSGVEYSAVQTQWWSTLLLEYSGMEYSAEGQLSISRQALVRDQFEISDVILARDILPVTL